MQIGFIGLGKMGANMVKRLVRNGHDVAIWNRSREKTDEVAKEGAKATYTVKELVDSLTSPKRVWVMVPSGDATEAMIDELIPLLAKGDTIIDGGNSNFTTPFADTRSSPATAFTSSTLEPLAACGA